MKNRSILLAAIPIITIVFLTGCTVGSYTVIIANEKNTPNSMVMSYSSFDGFKYRSLNLREGDNRDLSIDVSTKEGSLEVSLIDEKDNKVFKTENPREEIHRTINIDENGKYRIKVEGNHKGSYRISWDIH